MVSLPSTLPGGFVLRPIASDADLEGVRRLLGSVFGPLEAGLAQARVDRYPGFNPAHYLIVEDPAAPGPATTVVSSLCLTLARWSLGGVVFPVGIMELVATEPRYRGRGLQAALSGKFEELARSTGCPVTALMGIVGFYSNFGYVHASPYDESAVLPVDRILQAVADDPFRDRERVLETRPVQPADYPAAITLWDESNRSLDLHLSRNRTDWDFVFGSPPDAGEGAWHVVTGGGAAAVSGRAAGSERAAGLFELIPGAPYQLNYLTARSRDAFLEAFRFAAAAAQTNGRSEVSLRAEPGGAAHRVALSLGAEPREVYAWQTKITDRAGLLRLLAPVLERRLEGSAFRGLTTRLPISFYGPQLTMDWVGGRLVGVDEAPTDRATGLAGAGPTARMRMPEMSFVQLVLGYRSIGRLAAERQDVRAPEPHRHLVDTLFPPLRAWIEYVR